MKDLAPSILAADFNRLGGQIKEIGNTGTKYLHIDVCTINFIWNAAY